MIQKNRKKALVLAISSALWGTAVYAQEQAATPTTDESVDEIVIKGVRASQAKAIDNKRNNANIVDSIVAEDIGKLPDATITDSLQRVTGVQIKREANEGTSLNVRGMPQVMTTLNGEQFLSPWNITDVGANYGDIPAGMINGVDVYKSQSANILAGGISGLVDLKTIRPLKMKEGFTGSAKIEASRGEYSSTELKADGTKDKRHPDDNISVILGYNNDGQFGVTAGAFKSNTYNANYQIRTSQKLGYLDKVGGTPGDWKDIDGDGDLVNDWYLVPGEFSAQSSFMERDRQGGNISFEAAIGDNFTARADVFYTRMDQYERSVAANFDGGSSPESYSVNGSIIEPRLQPGTYSAIKPASQGTVVTDVGDFTYVDANGVTQTRHLHTLQVANLVSSGFQTDSLNNITRTAALNSNFELAYDSQDRLKATLRVVHAEAEKQNRSIVFHQGNPGWNWVDVDGTPGKDPVDGYPLTVDYRGEYPSLSYVGDLSQANLLQFYQALAEGGSVEAKLNVLRTDVNYELDSGILASFDAGFRYGVRDAHNTKFLYVTPTQRYDGNDYRTSADDRWKLREGNEVWQRWPDFRNFDYNKEVTQTPELVTKGHLANNGFSAADTMVFRDFGPFKGFEGGVSALDPAQMDDPLAFLNRLYPSSAKDIYGYPLTAATVNDPAFEYTVQEATTTGYAQLNLDDTDGFWGIPYKGNIGVQIISTDRTIEKSVLPENLNASNSIGFENQAIAFVSTKETIEYSFVDVLPSANFNFFPSDDVIIRFGAAQTTSRNDLKNLGENPSVWTGDCLLYKALEPSEPDIGPDGRQKTVDCVQGGTDQGNPYMKPWLANVYNSSAEWYFDKNAMVAVGLFKIDVKTSVQNFQEQRPFRDLDGVYRGNIANVWAAKNVGASSLYGLELGYKQPFTFLPSFLSATGIEANYTYSQSESVDKDFLGEAFPLPSNSKHQSNLVLWYDKSGINVRLAVNWKSKEYDGRFGVATQAQPISMGNWIEPQTYVDLSSSYWINEHVSLTASATNLTAQNKRSYSQYTNQFNSMYIQERRYNLGISLSL